MQPKKTSYPWIKIPTNPLRIYFDLCIMKYFLGIISPNNDMAEKLKTLLAAYALVDTMVMVFPEGWECEPLWLNKSI